MPSWSQTDEKTFLDGLLKDLNENLLAGLDPNPNLSRSKQKPLMYPAMRSGTVERIVFVGGSNAKNLSQAASMLGIDAYMIQVSSLIFYFIFYILYNHINVHCTIKHECRLYLFFADRKSDYAGYDKNWIHNILLQNEILRPQNTTDINTKT